MLYSVMAYAYANNPVILSRLEVLFGTADWSGLTEYLGGLSNRDFRCAVSSIGERVMPVVADDVFWTAFRALLAYHSKAFLVTMLKAVPARKKNQGFTLFHGGFLAVAEYLNAGASEVDRAKFIGFMLKVFTEEVEEVEHLFSVLHVDHPRSRLDFLLKGGGLASYYLLFKAMRQLEHDKDLLARCCVYLMKKGDSLSFNLASVSKAYFDLPQVKGTFSLRLNPYQLGHIESSFASFRKVMLSI